MTIWNLVASSFRHYGRRHLGLLLGTALCSAILAGSLLVGDSVKGSLKGLAGARLGKITTAFAGGDRFFTESLSEHLPAGAAPVVVVPGVVSEVTVQVVGVDERFWQLSPSGRNPFAEDESTLVLGRPLADALDAKVGDLILCRAEIPGMLSKDAPLSGSTENDTTVRRKVGAILEADDLAEFGLRNVQEPALNLFLPLAFLQERLEKPGRVNLILGNGDPIEMATATHAEWSLDDVELQLRQPDGVDGPWELSSGRVFVSQPVTEAIGKDRNARGVITYLVNAIETENGAAPYSMATATDEIPNEPGTCTIVQWLADDQEIAIGDQLTLRYLVVEAEGDRKDGTATFTVGAILPMDDPRVGPGWSPEFPGVSEAENCRDWDPGIDIDLDAIRDQDEEYWDLHKGTPKVFVSLEDGDRIWSNRFGNRTALRFEPREGEDAAAVAANLKSRLDLAQFGFETRDLAGEATRSVDESLNLGMYFGYFAFFLVLAALLLSALLFLFTIESRSEQIGVMRSVGMSAGQVRGSLLLEGGLVAVAGSLLGLLGGFFYAKLALHGLGGIWSDAVNGMRFRFHAQPLTLIGSFLGSVAAALLALWFSTRSLFKIAPKDLVAGSGTGIALQKSYRPKAGAWLRSPALWISALGLLGGIAVLLLARGFPGEQAGFAFAGAGALLLVAGISMLAFLLRFLDRGGDLVESAAALGRRNAVRRRGRSLAVAALMASGVFLVAAVNAFRLDSRHAEGRRDSGTGGFQLVADSSLPVYEKIDSKAGEEAFGLDPEDLEGVSVVPLRVGKGEDASCLNLNRAQRPLLVGVDPDELAKRSAFVFKSHLGEAEASPWNLLGQPDDEPDVIPGVVDFNTATYAMGARKLGDLVEYRDDHGAIFQVRLVGLLAGSMLQGRVLISESNFVERHPTAAGYRSFLIDAPPERTEELESLLNRMLGKRGFSSESAVARLDAYNAVQNGYLGIFTVLGGLGVLLGTVGLGVLVARNVGERRGEIGLLQAIGFGRSGVLRMLLGENVFLLVGGLLVGLGAAVVAVWPQFRDPSSQLPVGFLFGLCAAILLAGFCFCALAGWNALRRPLLDSIRSE